ncbi:MAG: phage tail protein [Deltaproteobacteria bacterium]|nr:phage tail protein [Deltaproteobacteria bacterium]
MPSHFGGWMAFQTFSGLSMTVAAASYGEGGAMAPMKEPMKATFADVSFTRGVGVDYAMHNWILQNVNMAAKLPIGSGLEHKDLAQDIVLYEMDRTGAYVNSWVLRSAFPVAYTPGDWNFGSDEVTIESMTITYWYFERQS